METITSQQPSIDIVYDWFKPEGCPPDRNALQSLVSYPKLTKTGETVDVPFSVIKDEDNKLFSVMYGFSSMKRFDSLPEAENYIRLWDAESLMEDLDSEQLEVTTIEVFGILLLFTKW